MVTVRDRVVGGARHELVDALVQLVLVRRHHRPGRPLAGGRGLADRAVREAVEARYHLHVSRRTRPDATERLLRNDTGDDGGMARDTTRAARHVAARALDCVVGRSDTSVM